MLYRSIAFALAVAAVPLLHSYLAPKTPSALRSAVDSTANANINFPATQVRKAPTIESMPELAAPRVLQLPEAEPPEVHLSQLELPELELAEMELPEVELAGVKQPLPAAASSIEFDALPDLSPPQQPAQLASYQQLLQAQTLPIQTSPIQTLPALETNFATAPSPLTASPSITSPSINPAYSPAIYQHTYQQAPQPVVPQVASQVASQWQPNYFRHPVFHQHSQALHSPGNINQRAPIPAYYTSHQIQPHPAWDTSKYSLLDFRRLMANHRPPTQQELQGVWRGINKGIATVAIDKRFVKQFQYVNGQIYGDNITVKKMPAGWQPKYDIRTNEIERQGKFLAQAPHGIGAFRHGVVLNYSKGGNGKLDPANLISDRLVKLDDNHLLGRATAKFGPLEIPLSYFVLQRATLIER